MRRGRRVRGAAGEHELPGRVRYYGCPAEEGGAAKAFMVREGLFADADAAVPRTGLPAP
jgi:aminobenzoyl-glutamate utilization protein B